MVISPANIPHRLKKRTNLAKLRAAVRLGASSGSKVEEEKTQELVQVLHEQLRECEKQADDPSDNTSEKKLKLPIIRRDSRSHPFTHLERPQLRSPCLHHPLCPLRDLVLLQFSCARIYL